YDINAAWQQGRCVADPGSVKVAYSSGRITNGRQMAKVAMIDLRDNDDREEHYNFRTYVTRARLLKANGTADNQAIWRTADAPAARAGGAGPAPAAGGPGGGNATLAFNTMNQWLAAVEADHSTKPIERKIIDDRPTLAKDTCFENGAPAAASACDAVYHT